MRSLCSSSCHGDGEPPAIHLRASGCAFVTAVRGQVDAEIEANDDEAVSMRESLRTYQAEEGRRFFEIFNQYVQVIQRVAEVI